MGVIIKTEVKLNDTWHEIVPLFEEGDYVYFSDPRPTVIPAPCSPVAPVGPIVVNDILRININDLNYYRKSRTRKVWVDSKSLEVVGDRKPNDVVVTGVVSATITVDR